MVLEVAAGAGLRNCLYLPEQFLKQTFVSSLKLDVYWLSLNKTCFAASEKTEGDSKLTKERSKQRTWVPIFPSNTAREAPTDTAVTWAEPQGSASILNCTLLPGRNKDFQFFKSSLHVISSR